MARDFRSKIAAGDNFPLHLTLFLLCLVPLVLSVILHTDGVRTTFEWNGHFQPVGTFCLFREATGYQCPVCGMTRCFIYLSHFQFRNAWTMNPAGIAVYLLCIFEACYRLFLILSRRATGRKEIGYLEKAVVTLTLLAVSVHFMDQFLPNRY